MTTQVAEIGIAAVRTLAETGVEAETFAKSEELNDNEMVETGFAMIETGAAATTETAATIAAMTAIVGTKETGGTTAIATMAEIDATTEMSAVIGTGGVAIVARVTTIDEAWTVRIFQEAKNRRGRGLLRRKIGFGEAKIWSSFQSRSRVGICGTRKLRMLALTKGMLKGMQRSLLTDGATLVRRTRTAVESAGEGSVARTRSASRKGPVCTWIRSRMRRSSEGRGAHSSRIVRRSPF